MPKRLENEELFEDGDRTIRFVADFGFGIAVSKMGKDITLIFNDLASGLMPIQDICNIMICGLSDIDGEEIKEGDKKQVAESLINSYGLQQCHQLSWVLLSHIMIGEKKSSEISVHQRVEAMTTEINPFHSTALRKVGLLWVGIWLSSAALACTTTSFFNQLIAL